MSVSVAGVGVGIDVGVSAAVAVALVPVAGSVPLNLVRSGHVHAEPNIRMEMARIDRRIVDSWIAFIEYLLLEYSSI
jgi:hypothetical protein